AFDILLPEPGVVRLEASHPDHAVGKFIGPPATRGQGIGGITIQLGPSAVIAGKVTDAPTELGQLRVHAMIVEREGSQDHVVPLARIPLMFADTRADVAADGTFVLRGLELGATYRIGLFEPGEHRFEAASLSSELQVSSGTRGVQLAYDPGVVLVFDAVDEASGSALETVTATATLTTSGQQRFWGPRTNGDELQRGPDGRFRAPPLRPRDDRATGKLAIEAPGFATLERERIALPKRGEVDLGVLELQRAPTLRVVVTHGDGPVDAARVRFEPTDDRDGTTSMLAFANSFGEASFAGPADGRLRGVTDDHGVCNLTLPPGIKGRIRVTHREFAPYESVELEPTLTGQEQRVELFRGGTILVTVLDSAGNTLPGISCRSRQIGATRSRPKSAETDARGIATLEHLSDGDYAVELVRGRSAEFGFAVFDIGQDAESREGAPEHVVRIENGGTVEITLEQPRRSTVVGRVTVDGEPLSGARVSVSRGDSPEVLMDARFPLGGSQSARTDEDGEFKIEDVDVGEARLRLTHSSRAMPTTIAILVVEGETRHDLELRSTKITGRIVDASGDPVAGARVSAHVANPRPPDASRAGMSEGTAIAFSVEASDHFVMPGGSRFGANSVKSRKDGTFTLDGIREGVPVVVRATSNEHADAESEPMTLEIGETRAHVELRLPAGGEIEVRAAKGEEPFQFVTVTSVANPRDSKMHPIDGDRVTFRGLAQGRWTVSLQRGMGSEPTVRTVDVVADKTTTVTFD
ncbi:MAG: carboxypeptidase regulatory-like domain-containing protein, partial [Planctomycetes bacterium]|nr:carboxypeptidase regulatory-like domain-containing protein [Planctomycetota bacterium]